MLRTKSSHPAQSKLVIIHGVCAAAHPPSLSHPHHHVSRCSQTPARFPHTSTHTRTLKQCQLVCPPLPPLPSPVYWAVYGWMDGSVHTSPLLQTHPCCYIRALQRLTNQIIIATGHRLGEARGQWSNMAKRWTDAGKGTIAPPSCLGTHPVSLRSNSLNWAASLWLVHCWFVGFF